MHAHTQDHRREAESHPRAAHRIMSDTGRLQSPSPALVTARDRNCTVDPDTRPKTVVLACSVAGAAP
jgi:hypothetical protein